MKDGWERPEKKRSLHVKSYQPWKKYPWIENTKESQKNRWSVIAKSIAEFGTVIGYKTINSAKYCAEENGKKNGNA